MEVAVRMREEDSFAKNRRAEVDSDLVQGHQRKDDASVLVDSRGQRTDIPKRGKGK